MCGRGQGQSVTPRYTSSFQGRRYSRVMYAAASVCFAVVCCGSKSTRMPLRKATFPSKHVVVERRQISISLVGFCRVFMHDRKFAQWVSLPWSDIFTFMGCTSDLTRTL